MIYFPLKANDCAANLNYDAQTVLKYCAVYDFHRRAEQLRIHESVHGALSSFRRMNV